VLENIASAARAALQEADLQPAEVCGVGLGSPGPMDLRKGELISPVNLPTLHGFPIVQRLSEALGLPVAFNNDANCFGLAEARFGAGAGAAVCAGLTLGTGLGAFLVVGGRLYEGAHGAGVEIWCSPYCGDHVEEKVSGRGVARNYKKLTHEDAAPEQIAARAREGEEEAREAWREFGRDLAVPVAFLSNVTDPDVLVLGGSMVKASDLFLEALLAETTKYIDPMTREGLRIVPGSLGDSAGMLGAAALVLDRNGDEAEREAT
jgi:glucokinase